MLKPEDIHTICVCGAGTMGSGIAQVAAQAGYKTIQYDLNASMLQKSKASIETALEKLVAKQKLTGAGKEAICSRITYTSAMEDCIADVVIEAVVEQADVKQQLFTALAAQNGPATLLATNTSSLSVTSLAKGLPCPERLLGMHFFNPAPLMQLVEVVRTSYTSDTDVDTLVQLAKQMGKVPVVCADVPGFIVNRVARHYYLENLHLAERGLADVATIDAVLEATGFKMGPFRLMDLIGLDVNFAVSNIVWESLGKPERLRPSELQRSKVMAQELGRKSGKGFYDYS